MDVQRLPVRWLTRARGSIGARAPTATAGLILIGLAWVGCGEGAGDPGDPELELGRAYVASWAVGRAALEAALEGVDNGYATQRRARYTEDDWGALPVWDPPVRAVAREDLGRGEPSDTTDWVGLDADGAPWTREGLIELGRRAFQRYPVQVLPVLRHGLRDADGAARVGLGAQGGGVGGLVWVLLSDGAIEPAMTCATCHDGGAAGRAAADFDLGRLQEEARGTRTAASRWGPGRLDVTGDDEDNPTAIPDLRPVRFQTHLHRAATMRNDLLALAVRTETLLIASSGGAFRPPRAVPFAMALYLRALADDLPPVPSEGAGRVVFDAHCARCHGGPGLSGGPLPIADVGTPDAVARSPERGTGRWRVPSLRGLGDRGLLFAGGGVRGGIDELLDPARAMPGHPFGLALAPSDRRALADFLRLL